MRHIHDGELHAFLDGALDLLPEGRGEEIRAHLAECSACRERLQDEESIHSQAGTLLGEPDLSGVALPTFEELRQLADAPAPPTLEAGESAPEEGIRPRGPLKGLPLAWAATIILALGVGWMGGQVWDTLPSRTLPGRTVGPEAADVEVSDVGDFQEQSRRADDLATDAADPPGAPMGFQSSEAPAAASPDRTAPEVEPQTLIAEEEAGSPADPRAEEGLPEPPATGRTLNDDPSQAAIQLEEITVPDTAKPEALRTAERVAEPSAEEARVVAHLDSIRAVEKPSAVGLPSADASAFASQERERRAPTLMALSDAMAFETAGLAVPGYDVLSTEWEERVPGERALLIRQRLSAVDTLELRYLGLLLGTEPISADRSERTSSKTPSGVGRVYANVLAASLPEGWHQVAMERERGLVLARGPLSEEELKNLLKRIR